MSQPSSVRRLLAPLTPAYRLAVWLREMRLKSGMEQVRRLQFPVISIGNLSTGGTGKTPLTIALAQALTKHGVAVDVLSRGYGRKDKRAARVDPNGSAEQFGDEPLLIARQTGVPVYVARQRYDAGQQAEADRDASSASEAMVKPAVHLLDDGFQHRQLDRAVDIVLLNRDDYRDRLLPAGNLREPLKSIRRARIVALAAEDAELEGDLRKSGWSGTVWHLRRTMEIPNIDGPALAFCGIARADQFFEGLQRGGIRLAARKAFPDHHSYTAKDLQRVIDEARAVHATTVLTTQKDMIRLGNLANPLADSMPIHTVALRIEIEQEDKVIDQLLAQLQLSTR